MKIIDLELDGDFQNCFTTSAGAVTECECGREHVAINSTYFDAEDEELIAEYLTRAKSDDKVIIHNDSDTIGSIEIAGRSFAEGCECQGWKPYMDFIIQNRSEIKDFLIQLATRAQTALDQEKTFNVLKDKSLKVLDDHRW